MSTPKPPCTRCNGTCMDPCMFEPDFQPSYWELVNADPRPCSHCYGTGVEWPEEGYEEYDQKYRIR